MLNFFNLKNLSKSFLVTCIAIKICFSCFAYIDVRTNKVNFAFNFKKIINNDEWDLASRAYNLSHDRGLVKNVIKNNSISYKLSSNRPLLNVGIHYLYQKLYAKCFKLNESDIIGVNNTVDRENNYYKIYAIIINYVSLLLCLISGFFFIEILNNVGVENRNLIYFATGCYFILTSSLIYVGLIPLYENISLPVAVILLSLLTNLLNNKYIIKWHHLFVLCFLITFSVMIRPQILIPTVFAVSGFLLFTINKTLTLGFEKVKTSWIFILIFSFIFLIAQCSILIINFKYFDTVFYTNRADGFMWGHYDLARGSWDGTVDIENSEGYLYTRKLIPNFDNMTELQQNKSQLQVARNWMLENPLKELNLTIKKIMIFFYPNNFNEVEFSINMFLIHSLFFVFIFVFIFNFWKFYKNKALMLVLVFVFGVVFVNVLFFVEHRVKYFADPFMLIISIFCN